MAGSRVVPLTATGAGCLAGATVLLVAGLAAGYVALVVVGLSGLALIAGCGLVVGRAPRVEVRRGVGAASVACGEPVLARLQVRNLARLAPLRAMGIDRVGQDGVQRNVVVEVPAVPARQARTVEYQVPTARRGLITLGPLEFARSDPFGFWRLRLQVGDRLHVVVHPLVHSVEAALVGTARTVDGVARNGAPNGAVAFHSLREYVAGDDRRTIHWRSTARRGELMVRQLVDVVVPRLTVVLDTRADSYDPQAGDLDQAVELVASIVVACAAERVSCTVATTGGLHLRLGSTAEVTGALDALARVRLDASLGFVEVSERLDVPPGAALLVVSGGSSGLARQETSPADHAALAALSARHDRSLALVVDAASGAVTPQAPGRVASGLPPQPDRLAALSVRTCLDAVTALVVWAGWCGR
jgi:uncharacterized protein (DUF58 family)